MTYDISILVPATSHKRNYNSFKDTDLYIYLFKSFFSTYDKEHNYTIYLGIDQDDKFYHNVDVQNDIKKFISVMINTKIKIIDFNFNYKGNPCAIWTSLYYLAYHTTSNYFVQVGSDIMFLDKHWINCAIQKLKDNDDLGVVGLADQGRKEYNPKDSLFTQTIVSRKHLEIFGFYFPPEIKNWGCDNWIGDIYDKNNLKHYIYQRIYNCGGEPRYDVPLDFKDQYYNAMEKHKNKIKLYFDMKLDNQFLCY